MNIQICSDLHLDQIKNFNNFNNVKFKELIVPKGDILIIAGDLCHASTLNNYINFFSFLSENFQYIIYVPGNHEYYNNESNSLEEMDEMIILFLKQFENFIFLNNKSVLIENYLFTGSCLWCEPDVDPPPWFKINMKKEDIKNYYNKSVEYLNNVSSFKPKNHIIITHYPPLYIDNLEKKYEKGDKYEKYYKNKDLNLLSNPKYWIYGHNHKNNIKNMNNTYYLSNQRKDKSYNNSYTILV